MTAGVSNAELTSDTDRTAAVPGKYRRGAKTILEVPPRVLKCLPRSLEVSDVYLERSAVGDSKVHWTPGFCPVEIRCGGKMPRETATPASDQAGEDPKQRMRQRYMCEEDENMRVRANHSA
jgi:hypothetical protein